MGFLTPELVGSAIAAVVPTAGYCFRVWVGRVERREQRAAILAAAGNPVVLAALAKLDVPSAELRGPTALLLVAAAAGTLAANATLAAPILGVALPSQALGASLGADLPARCTPQDCRPPAACVHGHCEAAAKPTEPDPAAPAPAAPAAPSRAGAASRPSAGAPLGPHSGYARAPWAETMPGWTPFLHDEEPR